MGEADSASGRYAHMASAARDTNEPMNRDHDHKLAPRSHGHILLGNLLEVRRDRLRFLLDIATRLGDVVRFRMGPITVHLVNNPDHIQHVLQDNHQNYHKGIGLIQATPLLGSGLLTSEGELWCRQRRLLQPTFMHQRVAAFAPIMAEATAVMLRRWKAYARSGRPLDISSEMTRLTLEILGRSLFGTNLSDEAATIGKSFAIASEGAIRRMTVPLGPVAYLPTPWNFRFWKAIRTLDGFVCGMIAERHRVERGAGDLLSLMLSASDRGADFGMSDKQLRDELMTILLAGHETVASALTWSLYLLSSNLGMEHLLNAELAAELGGRPPVYQDLPNLVYTEMVLKESMRLYPPVWLIPRKSIEDDEIGGYHVPAGSHVLISPFAMHRHPAFWDDPQKFEPERFSDKWSAGRPRFAYLPFGGGPRHCIGSGFAMMEAKIIMAMVTQSYRLRLTSGYPIEPEPLLTLRPRHGMPMLIKENL